MVDLAGLSTTFDAMTATQFDAWLSGSAEGAYVPRSANDRYARLKLEALRELTALSAEIERLTAAMHLAHEASELVSVLDFVTSYRHRIEYAKTEWLKLHAYLISSGWNLPEWERVSEIG